MVRYLDPLGSRTAYSLGGCCLCRLSQCGCMDGFYEADAESSSRVVALGGVECAACPQTRLVASTVVNGVSSACTRMEPCTFLEQKENLTFVVYVRRPPLRSRLTAVHVCALTSG